MKLEDKEYFQYLMGRSRTALYYRKFVLFPKIQRYLKGRTLDIGCGIGDFLRFNNNCVGIDTNQHTVNYCKSTGLNVHAYDGNRFPSTIGAVDSFLLDNVLEHIEDPSRLFSNLGDVARPGSRLVIGVPCKRGYKLDADHKIFYGEAELKSLILNYGWSYVTMFYTPLPFMFSRLSKVNSLYLVAERP